MGISLVTCSLGLLTQLLLALLMLLYQQLCNLGLDKLSKLSSLIPVQADLARDIQNLFDTVLDKRWILYFGNGRRHCRLLLKSSLVCVVLLFACSVTKPRVLVEEGEAADLTLVVNQDLLVGLLELTGGYYGLGQGV